MPRTELRAAAADAALSSSRASDRRSASQQDGARRLLATGGLERSAPAAPQGSGGAPLPLWVAGGALGLSGAFALMAGSAATPFYGLALLTGAAATGGLGLFALAERALFRRRTGLRREPDAVLGDVFQSAPEPLALVDESGRLLALNAAGIAAAPEGALRAADLLADAEAPEAAAFRLLSSALQGERAEVRYPGPGGAQTVSGDEMAAEAWSIGGGRAALRWGPARLRAAGPDRGAAVEAAAPSGRAESGAHFGGLDYGGADGGRAIGGGAGRGGADGGGDRRGAVAAAERSAELAWARIGAHGAVRSANGVFQAWVGAAGADVSFHELFPDAARRLAPTSGAPGPRFLPRTRLSGADGAPGAVSLLFAPATDRDEALIYALPADSAEEPNIAPVSSGLGAASAHGGPLGAAEKLLGALDALQSVRLFEDAPIGVMVLDLEGRILRMNAASDRLLAPARSRMEPEALGVALSGALGDYFVDWLDEEDREEAEGRLAAAADGRLGAGPAFEARLNAAAEGRLTQCYLSRVDTQRGQLLLLYLIDSSEQYGLEQRFLHAQKLQAVGHLASGIAHDFNNLLTIIIGCSEALLAKQTEADPEFSDLWAIHQSGARAANLVKQLLAFSRQQTMHPQVTDLTDRLSEYAHILNRMISDRVTLRTDLAEGLWPVKVDVNQFEQVVMNLVVNASQAIKGPGRVTMRTLNETLEDEKHTLSIAIPPGDYVVVAVEDDGPGIPEEIRETAFVPFASTKKSTGEGTGLGLATAHGIVEQSGGYVYFDTETGVGTTFWIYLPRSLEPVSEGPGPERQPEAAASLPAAPPPAAPPPAAPPPMDGSERREPEFPPQPARPAVILLVEDETEVRALASRHLKNQGHHVLEADCAEDALALLEDPAVEIDMLLSDVVMPGMDGPSILRKLGGRRPELKTIFMSGHARDAFAETVDAALTERRAYEYVQKPFTLSGLANTVRKVLETG